MAERDQLWQPKASAIIPVYNSERTLARAINSMLAQRFNSCEIIAIDNGSTDSSFNILKNYEDRIRVLRQPNRAAAAARNAAARTAAGEYLAFLDADDEWLPGKLQACVAALDASPQAVAAYSDMLSPSGSRIRDLTGSPPLDYLLANQFALHPPATVVRRAAFERCGGFSEEFTSCDLGEDTFLVLAL
jgi:glycosyltransferase involved in cell wall biosynthesis